MSESGTTFVGPLGSTIHCLRADPETVAAVAGLDWNDRFRRVCLDPVRGVITLMAPSRLHEELGVVFEDLVDAAADVFSRTAKRLGSPRLRPEGDPPGTGMEPDCAFYVGEAADSYFDALADGAESAEAFLERNGPDLIVEVEITPADRGKIERYADLGVREFWRLRGRKDDSTVLRADFFALERGAAPRALPASEVLPGLTPEDVCEAVNGVRLGRSYRDRREAVARIVRRRQRASFRVREEGPGYGYEFRRGPDRAVSEPGTTLVGPLGSTIHRLRADPETVAAVAGLDWNDRFRRVCLDPARGVITLMAPSHSHEDLTGVFEDIVDLAAEAFGRAVKKLRSTRLRGEGDPPGTGMEPDCAFYVGDTALAFLDASAEGAAAAEAFLERNGPDLVVEVEITHADRGKIERYGESGVREFWRLHARKEKPAALTADFYALGRGGAVPRRLEASVVLPGLTPEDVCEAVPGVSLGASNRDRRQAVARIVRRRQEASLRVREEGPGYRTSAAQGTAP